MRISVIMPTKKGREYLLHKAIEYFHKQDYEDKELIIIGDDLDMPTIGEKRNYGCSLATGEVICHFDDDDYYATDYLTKSLAKLSATQAHITGLDSAYFFAPSTSQVWQHTNKGSQPYVIESGMMYRKSFWEKHPFKAVNSGEGLDFQANAMVKPHGYIDGFMAIIHGKNTASHKSLGSMKQVPPEFAESILRENYYFYKSMRADSILTSAK